MSGFADTYVPAKPDMNDCLRQGPCDDLLMALVLTIPGVVDSQELHSLHPEPDGVSFELTFDYNDTARRLMSFLEGGEMIALVVLTTDGGFFALDDVYVASASFVGGEQSEFRASLQAREVRTV
jgi:hypothetical protein